MTSDPTGTALDELQEEEAARKNTIDGTPTRSSSPSVPNDSENSRSRSRRREESPSSPMRERESKLSAEESDDSMNGMNITLA